MDSRNPPVLKKEPVRGPIFRDVGELIIKVIVIILVIAWFTTNFIQDRELDPFTLIILLLLLALMLWLIWHQRHVVLLDCDLTGPSGCVQGDTSVLPGRILEVVTGSAQGLGFSHYLIEVRDPGSSLLSDVVIYPDTGGSPDTTLTQGSTQVVSGALGWIDVEKAVNDAGIAMLTSTTFTVTLRVFGTDGSEHTPPCQLTFDISANEVYIKRVSTLWSVDFLVPSEPLRKTDDATADLGTAGGNYHVRGAANVYGCAGENIQEYTIWAIPDNSFSFAQPAPFTPVTPAPNWTQLSHIEFTAQTIDGTLFTADDVRAYNILDSDPNPDVLTNVWGTRNECICFFVDSTLLCNCWKVPDLKPKAFNSHTLPPMDSAYHASGTGKFTILLQVIDTNGHQFYDLQRVWVDNEPVMAQITGIGGLPACTDLYTMNPAGNFKTVNIEGIAWDALIDTGDATQPTSDNFDRYKVTIQKQGASGESALLTSTTTVPTARTKPVAAGTLAAWNLETLHAPSNPNSWPADQLLSPGESCTYDVILRVWDKTVVNENTVHYSGKLTFPIKIINSPEP